MTNRLEVFISIFFIKTQTQTPHSQWKTKKIWETEGESQRVEKEKKLRNLEKEKFEKSVRQLHQAVRQSNPRFLPVGRITYHSKLKDPFQSLFLDISIKKKNQCCKGIPRGIKTWWTAMQKALICLLPFASSCSYFTCFT